MEAMVKERPILFTPENAQKCHVGTKTQTRRIIKLPRWAQAVNEDHEFEIDKDDWPYAIAKATGCLSAIDCPYGEVGDRLWVREAWADLRGKGFGVTHAHKGIEDAESRRCREEYGVKWKPAIHMPRWACRTVLEITEIRVQRVKDISQADAIAEGAPPSHTSIDRVSREYGYADFTRSWYAQLWDSINGPGSWDANPWVWAITFRKVPQ